MSNQTSNEVEIDRPKERTCEVGKFVVFAMFVCPLSGLLVGLLVCFVQAIVLWNIFVFLTGAIYAVTMAPIIGLFLGLVSGFVLIGISMTQRLKYLFWGSIVGAVVPALLPSQSGTGMMFGFVGSIVGYVLALLVLLAHQDGYDERR